MTRSTTRWVARGLMALAALGAVAVFGVGSPTVEASPSVSPFAGSWSGTWSIAERQLVGTYTWTISDAGQITGTVHVTTTGSGGTIVGHVGADGDLMFVAFAPNDVPGAGFAGFSFRGTAVIGEGGELVATAIGLGDPQTARPSLVAVLERN